MDAVTGFNTPIVTRGKLGISAAHLFDTAKLVCSDCNNGWMSRLENKMKDIVQRCFFEKSGFEVLIEDELRAINPMGLSEVLSPSSALSIYRRNTQTVFVG